MAVVPVDLAQARSALASAAARTATPIRSVPDTSLRLPRLGWTIQQAAAHLHVVGDLFSRVASGELARWSSPPSRQPRSASPTSTPWRWAGSPSATGRWWPRRVEEPVRAFLDASAGRPGSHALPTPWYGEGIGLDLDEATAVLLGEHLVHGYDIAAALSRPWPIDPDQAALVLAGLTAMMPLYVNRQAAAGVRATYDVWVRGGPRFAVTVDDGTLRVTSGAPRADCHLAVEPAACVLVAYGRKSQWSAIVRGKMLAWGRKPWLALRFKGLILDP